MIFITIGTSKRDFSRLLREVDRLVALGVLRNVFAQIGASRYLPRHYSYKDYLSRQEQLECMRQADLVIAHAGGGTLEECLAHQKKVITVPRKAALREAGDDHQMELARFLEETDRALVAWEVTDLQPMVEKAKLWTPRSAYPQQSEDISLRVALYIEEQIAREAVRRGNWWLCIGMGLFWSLQ